MEEVELEGGTWQLGEPLAQGGFGTVFEAIDPEGNEAVIKRIPKEPGAKRELLFEDLADVPNVIPVVDTGETEDAWLLAMPRAELSLRDYVEAAGGPVDPTAAIPILLDIVKALEALDGRVVHRDLKPDNILRHAGAWCIADFGIARYAEASTAPDTRKFSMTPPYAAPEQWRFEHASGATDVYAFGVMAFELLAGRVPFTGPTDEDLRDQHLKASPPVLEDIPAQLSSLVAECLLKAPEARPTPASLKTQLDRVAVPASPAAGRLQQANLEAVQREAEKQAAASAARSDTERLSELLAAGRTTFAVLESELSRQIIESAPSAGTIGRWPVVLAEARLSIDPVQDASSAEWEHHRPAFEVVAYSAVQLDIPETRTGYAGRGASFWYCDAVEPGVFRWYETAFMVRPMTRRTTRGNPLPLPPGRDAGGALSTTMTEWQCAWPFTPIDQSGTDAFVERWLEWFATAAEGRLELPRDWPNAGGSYRTK